MHKPYTIELRLPGAHPDDVEAELRAFRDDYLTWHRDPHVQMIEISEWWNVRHADQRPIDATRERPLGLTYSVTHPQLLMPVTLPGGTITLSWRGSFTLVAIHSLPVEGSPERAFLQAFVARCRDLWHSTEPEPAQPAQPAQPAARDDTKENLTRLRAIRRSNIRNGKVTIAWSVACQQVPIDRKTARTHAQDLRARWDDPTYDT